MELFRKVCFCFILFFLSLFGFAQYKVHFVINNLPAYTQTGDKIFLVGSINNWNPHDERLALKWENGKPGITIDLVRGKIEYKFTRGSWETVESANGGFPTQNRSIMIEHDTTIQVEVAHWADHFPKKAKQSTASRNVHVIDTAFFIPQLNRHRRVWIYLPESYASSGKKYPVLYMHDARIYLMRPQVHLENGVWMKPSIHSGQTIKRSSLLASTMVQKKD